MCIAPSGTNCERKEKRMSKLQEHLAALIDEHLVKEPAPVDDVENVVGHPVETSPAPVPNVEPVEEITVYTATPAEINYWHAHGSNVFLQTMLREYDLNNSSENVAAYNHFRIGLDEKNHRATFAIDDVHYLAIEFNQRNCAPVDKTQARRVLEKICAIRIASSRFVIFCGIEIERFD